MSPPGYDVAVRAWAEHLRSGGTTPWSAWLAVDPTAPTGPEATAAGHPAHRQSHEHVPHEHVPHDPHAIHLELLRRLNLRGEPAPGLADRLLETGAAGRGRVDPPLSWPGEPHRFGTPPVDPEQLPAEELLRLAVSLVARLLPGVQAAPPTPPASRWPIPGRRRFRLHGSPRSVARLRASLLAQGLVESDWRPVHLVVGRPVEVMLGEHWAEGSRHGGSVALDAVWRRARAAGRLPRSLDLPRLAASVAEHSSDRVHVVIGRDLAHVSHLAAGVLEAREDPERADPGPDPTTADLLRRLNRLLALTAGPDRVQSLAATLEHVVLADVGRPEAAYPVPVRALGWAEDLADSLADSLDAGGTVADYAVHGRLTDLRPDRRAPRRLDPDNTLDLALSACLRAWQLQGGT